MGFAWAILDVLINQANAQKFATFMGAVGENPEAFREMLSDNIEDVDE